MTADMILERMSKIDRERKKVFWDNLGNVVRSAISKSFK